jgi:hypothetical protein
MIFVRFQIKLSIYSVKSSLLLRRFAFSEFLLCDETVSPLDLGRREGEGPSEEGTVSPGTKLEAALNSSDGVSFTAVGRDLDTGRVRSQSAWRVMNREPEVLGGCAGPRLLATAPTPMMRGR